MQRGSGMQGTLALEWPARYAGLYMQLLVQGQGTTDPVGLRAAMHDALESGRLSPRPSAVAPSISGATCPELVGQGTAPLQRTARQRARGAA